MKYAEAAIVCGMKRDCKHDNLFEVKKKRIRFSREPPAVTECGIMRTSSSGIIPRAQTCTCRLHNSPDELLETVKCISNKRKKTNNLYIIYIYGITTYVHAAICMYI